MKLKTILTLLLVAVGISAQAQYKKVVEKPYTRFANTTTIEIDKVTLSDTETVLDINAFFRPGNWIRIVSDTYLLANGKKYIVRGSEGIDLDSQFWMPESGEASFKLTFEPLPKTTHTFDFIESDCNDCFKIYGIDLENKYKEKPIKTTLIGKVNNRPQSKRLLLAKAGADLRLNHHETMRIDTSGNFQHTLYADEMEAYMLIFDEEYGNSWQIEVFFPDADTISINLNPMHERIKNRVEGGKINKDYQNYISSGLKVSNEYERERKRLINIGSYYTKEYAELINKYNTETNQEKKDSLGKISYNLFDSGNYLSSQGLKLEAEFEEKFKKNGDYAMEWISKNGTLAGYYALISWLNVKSDRPELIDAYYNVYAKKFPKHPFTLQVKDLIKGIELSVGRKFIDFTAPDGEGINHTLSELIDGKVAMINLWASWCAPCRIHSMELIPVFEKYKDRGFTVVGIAREYDKRNMNSAITKDGYPWLNLLELNDSQNIWAKYGAPGAGGRLILVNKNGVILALDPPIEETIKIVEKELSK
jgi:thiol-disulfide isomerase/thioredoxin